MCYFLFQAFWEKRTLNRGNGEDGVVSMASVLSVLPNDSHSSSLTHHFCDWALPSHDEMIASPTTLAPSVRLCHVFSYQIGHGNKARDHRWHCRIIRARFQLGLISCSDGLMNPNVNDRIIFLVPSNTNPQPRRQLAIVIRDRAIIDDNSMAPRAKSNLQYLFFFHGKGLRPLERIRWCST